MYKRLLALILFVGTLQVIPGEETQGKFNDNVADPNLNSELTHRRTDVKSFFAFSDCVNLTSTLVVAFNFGTEVITFTFNTGTKLTFEFYKLLNCTGSNAVTCIFNTINKIQTDISSLSAKAMLYWKRATNIAVSLERDIKGCFSLKPKP